MGIYVKFYHDHSTNIPNFYFLPKSILNFRKVTKFGGNWLKNEKVTGKCKTRGGRHPLPPQCL